MPIPRRGTREPKRIRRTDRRGMSPVTFGAICLVVLLVIVYFGFTKAIPFQHGFRLNAVFESANSVRSGSPVRIAGVNVGKVVSVRQYKGSDASVVQMEIDGAGLPIHKDATVKIRPRIFLEGNFFVDLRPGTPSAPKLEDDDAPLAMTQTSAPVQFDEILTGLQLDTRKDLQGVLSDLGTALNARPTAAQDAQADPEVRGETAGRSLRDSATYSYDALRGASVVNSALLGVAPDDLARLVRDLGRVSGALGRNEGALQGLIVNFNRTAAALAAEQGNLASSIRLLPGTLTAADGAFDALNRSFPPVRAFARDAVPGVLETPATIDAAFPFIAQTRKLVSAAELGGLVAVARPTTADLSQLVDATIPLLRQTTPLSQCVNGNINPSLKTTLRDGNLTTGVQNYKEGFQGFAGAAGESQNFDANGQWVRFGVSGGATAISTPNTTFGGPGLFGNTILPPLGTRPRYPGVRPPYRPDVPCASQTPPNLTAPAGPPLERVGG